MRFSEALRLGIGIVQENRRLFLIIWNGEPCGCALGTAAYAVGLTTICNERDECLLREFPILRQRRHESPLTIAEDISSLHLLGWSREEIADWVESLEQTKEELCTDKVMC